MEELCNRRAVVLPRRLNWFDSSARPLEGGCAWASPTAHAGLIVPIDDQHDDAASGSDTAWAAQVVRQRGGAR
jgi:hypothetical protein